MAWLSGDSRNLGRNYGVRLMSVWIGGLGGEIGSVLKRAGLCGAECRL